MKALAVGMNPSTAPAATCMGCETAVDIDAWSEAPDNLTAESWSLSFV